MAVNAYFLLSFKNRQSIIGQSITTVSSYQVKPLKIFEIICLLQMGRLSIGLVDLALNDDAKDV